MIGYDQRDLVLDPRTVRVFLEGGIPEFMLPRFVETRPDITKSARQKVQCHLLLDRLPTIIDLRSHTDQRQPIPRVLRRCIVAGSPGWLMMARESHK